LGGHQFCQEGLQVLVLYGQSVLETVAEVVGRRIDPGETSDPVYGSPAVGDEVCYNTGSSHLQGDGLTVGVAPGSVEPLRHARRTLTNVPDSFSNLVALQKRDLDNRKDGGVSDDW
jgi:hypothetical protein